MSELTIVRRLLLPLSVVLLAISGCGGGGSNSNTDPEGLTPINVPLARGLLPSLKTSDGLFENVHFSGSNNCASCHNNQTGGTPTMVDSTGRDLSLGKAWNSSMMANSARDPYWHAVVASEADLYPNLPEEINDTCSRCHAPMANEVGRRTGNPVQILNSGSVANGDLVTGLIYKDASDPQFKHAMEGVSCSLCHQIADDGNLGQPQGMTGGFHIEQYGEADIAERPAYGQYDDVVPGYMQNNAKFKPLFGAHISSSETCGSCHNLVSHSVDRNGQTLAEPVNFPEQMSYSEWEASSFAGAGGQTCQSCHMPVVADAVQIASNGAGDTVRNNFAEHTFLGANTVMMSMMDQFRTELGIDPTVDFDEAILRNREFLTSAADLALSSAVVADGTLTLDVEINNKTGHKLPSGYHSRRVYLHVLVTNADGQVVYENGAINPDGSIKGLIEDVNPYAYEPHYDVITEATQVQVYQSVMGNSDNERTHSLLNGSSYIKDNRLLPAGFNKNTVSSDIAPTGQAVSDPDFAAAKDSVQYQIPVPAAGPYNVLVELNYQPLAFGHLQTLFERSDKIDEIDRFRTLYDALQIHHETIASVQSTVGP